MVLGLLFVIDSAPVVAIPNLCALTSPDQLGQGWKKVNSLYTGQGLRPELRGQGDTVVAFLTSPSGDRVGTLVVEYYGQTSTKFSWCVNTTLRLTAEGQAKNIYGTGNWTLNGRLHFLISYTWE